MIWLIEWLFLGHAHRWQETHRRNLVWSRGDTPHGEVSYCTCTVCGKPKRFKLV